MSWIIKTFAIVLLGFSFSFAKVNSKENSVKKTGSKKITWYATYDNTLDPRKSILIMKKDADGYLVGEASDVTEISQDNPLMPIYLEVLGEFKEGETKKIASIDEFNKKIEALKKKKSKAKPKKDLPSSVGVATMKQDGTLHMQLRSEDHGMIAEALKIVKPTDPEYQRMLDHLGGLKPGEAKSIPPFEN